MFNPSYGRMGLIAMPYFFIFEMIGPLIEMQGYIMVAVAFFLGLLNLKLAVILFLSTVLMGTMISILSLLIAEKDLSYFSYKDIFTLILYAVIENFGPRQLFSFWRVGGYFNMLKKPQGWGKIERKGRAYGLYTADVSEYVLGYLVGRELEPEEVLNTNKLNAGYSNKGAYLSVEEKASPTEAWLAMNCDYVAKYENEKYNAQHSVAIVSWPTLDPTEHDSEWNEEGDKYLEYNDGVFVDINNIKREDNNKAGFFGAYHIYPNYPDFMNNEPKYDSYSDEEGRFRYGGYLKEFIEGHTKYPALVAEFGLATGMGNAHTNPDGYNHGGMTEEQQGEAVVRMMNSIKNEGYAGGLIFEWMDEWAKKTWIN